jgi:hypothetical protein
VHGCMTGNDADGSLEEAPRSLELGGFVCATLRVYYSAKRLLRNAFLVPANRSVNLKKAERLVISRHVTGSNCAT